MNDKYLYIIDQQNLREVKEKLKMIGFSFMFVLLQLILLCKSIKEYEVIVF